MQVPLTNEQVAIYHNLQQKENNVNSLLSKEQQKLKENNSLLKVINWNIIETLQFENIYSTDPFDIDKAEMICNTDTVLRYQVEHNKILTVIDTHKKLLEQNEKEKSDIKQIIYNNYNMYMESVGDDFFGRCQICLEVHVPTKIIAKQLKCMIPNKNGIADCLTTICLDCTERYFEDKSELKCILCRKEYYIPGRTKNEMLFHVDNEKMRMIQRKVDRTWSQFLVNSNIHSSFIKPFFCKKCNIGFNDIFQLSRHKLGEGDKPCLKMWKQCEHAMCTNAIRMDNSCDLCDEHHYRHRHFKFT
jgi:hypothetical protein